MNDDGVGASEETVVTEAEDDWPVAEQYRIQPRAEQAQPSYRERVVVTQTQPERRRRPPPGGWPGSLGVVAAVLLALIAAAVLLGMRDGDDKGSAATAPPTTTTSTGATPKRKASARRHRVLSDVGGMQLAAARTALEKSGVRVEVRRRASSRPAGEILSQAPATGARIASGQTVVLTVSTGRPAPPVVVHVTVPGVVGLSASDAVVTLHDAGLQARIVLRPSAQSAGTVLRQSPAADTSSSRDAVVRLVVAKNAPAPHAAEIDVPDLVGAAVADARSQLRSLGLAASVVRVASQEAAGTVVRQTPQPGSHVTKGASVRLSVSTGPQQVAVPDVTGLDEGSARSELEDAGFEVDVVDEPTSDASKDGIVLSQQPRGRAAAGSTITLTVGRVD